MQVQLPAATSQTCEAGNRFIKVPQPGRMVDCHLKDHPPPCSSQRFLYGQGGGSFFSFPIIVLTFGCSGPIHFFLPFGALSVRTSHAPSWTMGETPKVPCQEWWRLQNLKMSLLSAHLPTLNTVSAHPRETVGVHRATLDPSAPTSSAQPAWAHAACPSEGSLTVLTLQLAAWALTGYGNSQKGDYFFLYMPFYYFVVILNYVFKFLI